MDLKKSELHSSIWASCDELRGGMDASQYKDYVLDQLAEEHQYVKGVIIALKDDLRIRRALRVAQVIDFYRYEVSFKLKKAE